MSKIEISLSSKIALSCCPINHYVICQSCLCCQTINLISWPEPNASFSRLLLCVEIKNSTNIRRSVPLFENEKSQLSFANQFLYNFLHDHLYFDLQILFFIHIIIGMFKLCSKFKWLKISKPLFTFNVFLLLLLICFILPLFQVLTK